jgi:DNA-binding protein H-NS
MTVKFELDFAAPIRQFNFMANTYSEIQKQIARLQAEAEKLRRQERSSVVEKIKVAIATYGLTGNDLFDAPAAPKLRSKSKSKIDTTPRYANDSGETWVGRGPRPQWLRDALAAGGKVADFAVDHQPGRRAANGAVGGKPNGEAKRTVAVKYRDGANVWSGRGSRPKWLAAALEAGKKIEQYLV